MNIVSSFRDSSVVLFDSKFNGVFVFFTSGTGLLNKFAVTRVEVAGVNNTVIFPSIGRRYFAFTFGSNPATIKFVARSGLIDPCEGTVTGKINSLFLYTTFNSPILRFLPSFLLIGSKLFIGYLIGAEIRLLYDEGSKFRIVEGVFTFSAIG